MPDCVAAVEWDTAPQLHQCDPERRRVAGERKAFRRTRHTASRCTHIFRSFGASRERAGGTVERKGREGRECGGVGDEHDWMAGAGDAGGMLLGFHAQYSIYWLNRSLCCAGSPMWRGACKTVCRRFSAWDHWPSRPLLLEQ